MTADIESNELILTPKSEIEARIKKLQSLMKTDGIDGTLIFGSVNMCYFTGTGQDGLAYITTDSPPIVMIRKSSDRAKEESPLEVRPLKSLKTIKTNLDIPSESVIGLELDILPYNNYSRVKQALGDAKFLDVSDKIKHLRSLKSNFEIELTKHSSKILDAGIASVAENMTEGITEIELASKVESVMRSMGHQGALYFRRFNHMVPLGHLLSGPNGAVPSFIVSPTGGRGASMLMPQGPGFRKIRRNEPVAVDFGGVYNGYTSDETRIFSLGKLPSQLEDAYDVALEIEKAIARDLNPGRTGRDLFEFSEARGEKLGYKDHLGGTADNKCGFVGHGVGLELNEYPVLGPVDHYIQPNMTIAVEPKMIYAGVGVVGIEDTFLTTENGAKRLTSLPQEIWQL